MRNCLSIVPRLHFFFVLCYADRPEIKNDADETISSSSNQTQTVDSYALLNNSRREKGMYAQWMTMPDYWQNAAESPIPYSSDRGQPDQTFHAFFLLGEHEGPTEAMDDAKAHRTPLDGVSKFMRVWSSTTAESEPTPGLKNMIAKHGKYMVFQDDVDDFLELNHDMVQDRNKRDFEDLLFLYGYVMGPHKIPNAGSVYFHTYYVYAERSETTEQAWEDIDRPDPTKSPSRRDKDKDKDKDDLRWDEEKTKWVKLKDKDKDKDKDDDLGTRWDEEKTKWVKLPDTINLQSILLESSHVKCTQDLESSHVKCTQDLHKNEVLQEKTTRDSYTVDPAVWTTCMNKLIPDMESIGRQTHVIQGLQTNAGETPEVYHALQIFEPGNHFKKPTETMLAGHLESSCKFQYLDLIAFGITAKQTVADKEKIPLEPKELQPQTLISLDDTDLVFHMEYEMATTEADNFCRATTALFTSPHFKQSLLFVSSGTMLDNRINYHMYLVFESVKKWFDHTNSKEFAAWKAARRLTENKWTKLTDLVNMKSPNLFLHDADVTQQKMSPENKLKWQAKHLETKLKPWSLTLAKHMEDQDFKPARARLAELRAAGLAALVDQ